MFQMLHQGENFLLAKLPQIEQGAIHLLSKSGDTVVLHRILQTGEIVSSAMNIPLLRSLLQAIDSQLPQGQ